MNLANVLLQYWYVVLAVLAILGASYLDLNSTMMFMKRGTAVEGNPIVAWIQRTFPYGWRWFRMLAPLVLVALLLQFVPVRWATAILIIGAVAYWYVAYRNYRIARGDWY